MDEQKLKKAFSSIKFDVQKLESAIERLERKTNSSSKKDKEIDQILSILESLKSESYENTKRIEALNLGEKTLTNSENNLVKEIDDLKKKLNSIENKPQPISSSSSSNPNIEEVLNEFSELVNEKMTIEINSLRLEFTEEIAKLYDKCFNEIVELKAQLNKKEKEIKKEPKVSKEKVSKSLPSDSIETKKESKLKKISKFLFVDEDEDEINSIKDEVKKK